MAQIWEHYSPEKKYSRQYVVSPCFETVGDSRCCNTCEVNPLLRFSEINAVFNLLDEVNMKGNCQQPPEMKFSKYLGLQNYSDVDFSNAENIVFHLLALKDFETGLDAMQIQMNYLDADIESGYFGESVKEKWTELVSKDKNIILYLLVNSNVHDENCFVAVLIKLFAEVSLVWEKDDDVYYLYIGEECTEYRTTLFLLVKELFWPVDFHVEVVWKYHYGIIGANKMMQIDEISII